MEGEFRRGGLVGPVILIGLGVVFLLNNLGILEWNVWDVLLRTWPLLLIAVGIDLLIVRRTTEATLFTLVLILVVIAGGVWFVAIRGGGSGAPRVETVQHPLPETDQVEIQIKPGVGILRLTALDQSDDLVLGKLGLGRGQEVEQAVEDVGSVSLLNLSSSSGWFWPAFRTEVASDEVGENEWKLALNREIPIRLSADLGLGLMDLDLAELMLEDLRVDIGLGQVKIILPESGEFNVRVSSAIGLTEILVPRGLAVRISFDTGLTVLEVEGFRQEGDIYYSPAWRAGAEGVNLEIDQAIGKVVVRLQ